MVGTAISVPALGAFAGGNAMGAMPAALLANLYVTGLNQLTDIQIDCINKPELPIPSGALSVNDGRLIVLVAAIGAIAMSLHSASLLTTTLASMVVGTLYSQKPFRLKQHPVMAALCIILIRGLIINVGFVSYVKGRFVVPQGPVLFFSVFAGVIAIMKDTPDTKGDFANNILSLALIKGRRVVYCASAMALSVALTSVAVALWSPLSFIALVMVAAINAHTKVAWKDNSQQAAASLYQFYWKCFYLCYIALFFM
jgi:homogentisate phytyltransferase/homogentisate geranylgeranyltransferase